jgi:hypothetical protein
MKNTVDYEQFSSNGFWLHHIQKGKENIDDGEASSNLVFHT